MECEQQRGWWFHLRRCAQCGHIGCCDNSPGQHATAHAEAIGHPWITSYEPEEHWFYNYRDQQFYDDIAPVANGQAIVDRITNATLHVYESGHLFLLQDPAAWPAIAAFLGA